MDIYFCDSCPGKPYTTQIKNSSLCPVCGSTLRYQDVNENSLIGRRLLGGPADTVTDSLYAMTVGATGNTFDIKTSDEFYMYLDFYKKGYDTFICRFILGDTPDQNGVINKTPVIGPDIKFTRSIDISELEKVHECIRRYMHANSWERYPGSYYSFKVKTPGMIKQVHCCDADIRAAEKFEYNKYRSESYYIEYINPSFSDITLENPFRHQAQKLTDKIKDVCNIRRSSFLRGMYFKSKDGRLKTGLDAAAGALAVVYDCPYSNLIRYDRLMREWCCE